MYNVNVCVTRIQEELEKLRTMGVDTRNLEKEVYEISIPEEMEFKKQLFLREVKDPSIPEGPSITYGVFTNNLDLETDLYISLNSKDDENLDLEVDELNVWNTEDGALYIQEI